MSQLRIGLLLLTFLLPLRTAYAVEKPKPKHAAPPERRAPAKAQARVPGHPPARTPNAAAPSTGPTKLKDETATLYRYRLSSGVGTLILQSEAALQFGSRFAAAFWDTPLFLSAEFNYAIYSPGALLGVLGGGWYELRVYGAPRLSVLLGVMAGVGSPSSAPLVGISSSVPAGFLEATIVQQVDDLVSVEGRFRPGVVGGYFAFMMTFGISFRFL